MVLWGVKMRFEVVRTSRVGPPCAGAKLHKVKEGQYKGHKIYCISITSLKGLIEFSNEVGSELILGESWKEPGTPMIEIYDDYRE